MIRSRTPPPALTAVSLLVSVTACNVVLPFDDLSEDSALRCHNGVDDDLDGQTDCQDPSCDGFCAEGSTLTCSNCRDDDGNGLADHADPLCWPHARARAGEKAGTDVRRCSSIAASALRLAPDGLPWRWRRGCASSGECDPEDPWEEDPTSGQRVARLEGGPECRGAGILGGDCDFVRAPHESTGGVCWTLDAELLLADQPAEAAFVVARELGEPPLARIDEALVVSVARRGGSEGARVALSVASGGAPHRLATLPDTSGWLRLRVESRAPDEQCHDDRSAALSVTLALADGSQPPVTIEGSDEAPVVAPSSWAVDTVLSLGVQAAATGTVLVRELSMERQRFDPCGYAVPQITGDHGGAAVVLAAARGGGRICAIGATTAESRQLERPYDPRRHHASPPELEGGAAPRRRFASWRAEDRGTASFGLGAVVEGPARSAALEEVSVRAAALSWDEAVGFEGVLLVSDDPRRGGRLVQVRSADCAHWEPSAFESADPTAASAHPLLYEARPGRAVLAVPAHGYSASDDPRCCYESECPALDREQCESDPTLAWPADCFVAGADVVPYVKPIRSECMSYPRATLLRAERGPGPTWSVAGMGSLPAFQQWSVGCGCRALGVDLPLRRHPSEVHQMLEAAGLRAFVVTGRAGIELVVDADTTEGTGTAGPAFADAVLMETTLLEPSGVPGTFDAAKVAEAHLLMLGHERANPTCPLEGLLFYRGFRSRVDREELVELDGGEVGVLPVRIAPASPDRLLRECLELELEPCR